MKHLYICTFNNVYLHSIRSMEPSDLHCAILKTDFQRYATSRFLSCPYQSLIYCLTVSM